MVPTNANKIAREKIRFDYFSLFVGALIALLATFATSLLQNHIAEKDRETNVEIERQKLNLGRDQLSTEIERLKLDRERFEYLKVQNLQKEKENTHRKEWEKTQLNLQIELQNKSLLGNIWSSCLLATAQVTAPRVLPASGGNMRSYSSMATGKDTIGCLKEFRELGLESLNVSNLDQVGAPVFWGSPKTKPVAPLN